MLVHVVEKQSFRLPPHLPSKPKPPTLQPPQSLTGRDIPATETRTEILQQGPDLADLAALDALSDIATQPLLLLVSDATRGEQRDRLGGPVRAGLGQDLEEGEQDAGRVRDAAGRERVHHAGQAAADDIFADAVRLHERLDGVLEFERVLARGRVAGVVARVVEDRVARGGGVWPAVHEEVPEEVERCDERFLFEQG